MMAEMIYDILFLLPFSAAAALLAPYAGDGAGTAAVFAVTAISAVYIAVMKHVKLRERVIMAGITLILLAAAVLFHPKGERIAFLADNAWIAKIIAIVALSAMVCAIADRRQILKPAIAAAGLVMLAIFAIRGTGIGKIAVCSVFFYAIAAAADTVCRRSVKEGESSPENQLVFISPFMIAIIVFALILPAPSKPYGWGFAKSLTESVLSGIAKINDRLSGAGWDSDTPFIGFSDRAGFGSSLTGIGYKVMDIKTVKTPDPYMYLSGETYDFFDGQSWNCTKEHDEDDVFFDTIETVSALIDDAGAEIPPELAKGNDITEEQDMSSHIFLPSKCLPGTLDRKEGMKVSFLRINVSSPEFGKILEEGRTADAARWNAAVPLCGAEAAGGYSYDDYRAYREDIYETYLPKTQISDELKDYMDTVLDGASSGYEKLTRIEAMLRSFRYTESPGALPDTIGSPADFLDYVIFDKKEGYCSYFATSFVLLARAYGIPARYVQGYRAETEGKLHSEVKSTDAHAWPEAYIDGIGWLSFEPTPGMRGIFTAAAWKTSDQASPYKGPENIGETEETGESPETEEEKEQIEWKKIALPVIFAAAFTLLIIAADAMLRRRRYRRMDERQKAVWLSRRCLAILKRRGLAKQDSETLSEYRLRCEDLAPEGCLDFCDIYEKILYSDADVTEDERKKLEAVHEKVRKTKHR